MEKKQAIEEKFAVLHNEVYCQMTNAEKNEFDPEVELPVLKKMPIDLKKIYNLSNREDTFENRRRREKRCSVLMKKLEDGDFEEAKKEIKSNYFRSINAISVDITDLSDDLQCRCCEKTVREKLRLCFDLVKYKSVKGIPFAMKNDVTVLINQWLDHAKTLKKCANSAENIFDHLKTDEVLLVYRTYLFVKKIILVECTDKADYDAKVAVLHKDKNLCAVYAAARVLSHFDKSALGDIPFVR